MHTCMCFFHTTLISIHELEDDVLFFRYIGFLLRGATSRGVRSSLSSRLGSAPNAMSTSAHSTLPILRGRRGEERGGGGGKGGRGRRRRELAKCRNS